MIEIIGSGLFLLVLGFLVGKVFEKLKLPGLLGMLIAGILLGPHQLNGLSSDFLSLSPFLRQFALLIILLRAGFSLKISDFKNMKLAALLMSCLPAIFEILAITVGALLLLKFPLVDALLLATVVAAVSPAVIVPKMVKIMDEGYGQTKKIPQLILAAASLDDVFILVLFSSALSLTQSNSLNWSSFLEIPVSIFLALSIGGVIGKVLSLLIKKASWIFQLAIIFMFSFLFFELEELFTFSALVGVISLAMSFRYFCPEEALLLKEKLTKLWIPSEIFLFALVGATVKLSAIQVLGFGALILLAFGLLIRSMGVYLSLSSLAWNKKEKLFCVISFWPKATVQAAIGAIPLAYGLPSGETILAISVLAILVTAPLGAIGIEKTYPTWLEKEGLSTDS